MAAQKLVPVVGLNYKEVRGDGAISTRGMALEAETTMAIERARRWLSPITATPPVPGARHRRPRRHQRFGVYGVRPS